MARSQPSPDDGREPEDRATTPNASIRRRFPTLRPVLSKSAGLATPHPLLMNGGHYPLPIMREGRRNRCAAGASAGGKAGCDERSRSELTGFLPAVGDRQIAGCSAANPRYRLSVSVGSSLRYLRYLRDLRANLGGSAALRLCVLFLWVVRLCVFVSSRLRRARAGRRVRVPVSVGRLVPGCAATTGRGLRP